MFYREVVMDFFEWDDSFSVGVVEIDDQHKQLIQMINDVAEAVAQGRPDDVQQGVLCDMVVYAGVHFSTEEKHMQHFNYSDIEVQKAQHHDYILKIGQFRVDLEAGKITLTQDILDFLKDWLKEHILVTDMRFKPFFNERGLK